MADPTRKEKPRADERPEDEGGGAAARGKRLSPSSQIGRTKQTGGTPETRPYRDPVAPDRPSVDGDAAERD